MNAEAILNTLSPFILAGVVALVGWVWHLWREIASLKADAAAQRLHVAENYTKSASLRELAGEVRHLSRVVLEIAAKLGVAVKDREP